MRRYAALHSQNKKNQILFNSEYEVAPHEMNAELCDKKSTPSCVNIVGLLLVTCDSLAVIRHRTLHVSSWVTLKLHDQSK